MTNPPDNTPQLPELPAPGENAATTPAGASTDGDGSRAPRRGMPTPSLRVTMALAVAMLAIGVGVGAAIGPAPSSSLAAPADLPALISSLAARAASERAASASASAAATAPAAVEETHARRHRRRRHHREAALTATTAPSSSGSEGSSEGSSKSTTPATSGTPSRPTLPPVTKVWLIELSGSTFSEALAHSSSAPYINTQAIPAGTLLSEWSGLDASAFATDAALLGGSPPQLVDTIVQPACPEGAAGVQCATGTPGALTAADEFLKATVPTITPLKSFRENGLIVVSFGSVVAGASTGLPSGSATVTLTAEPPAGTLLISPFAKTAARPSISFNPASPGQSLEELLRK